MANRQIIKAMYKKGVFVALIGVLTGLTVGVVVTFFALAAEILAEHSWDILASVRERPAYIPLLFLALALGAFMIATLTRLLPLLGSNGVPQTEGISRGVLKAKWYQALPAMAAASLLSIFMGLSAGAEGPCMFIGGMCGDAVSRPFGSTDVERRYQITGGACAGVAVAANAPLTGIVFALEEAHRRFTPSILICSFSAVISAIITRNLLYLAMGLDIASSLHGFTLAAMPAKTYLYVALAALVSGLAGVGLTKLIKLSRKYMMKLTLWKGFARYLIPFLFAGVIGMICVYATGGGHELINMLATGGGAKDMTLPSIFGSPIALTLFAIIILRAAALVLGVGAGVPCGIFVPISALGALIGALMSQLLVTMGMDKIFVDAIVLISMATIFAATVKAPLTAIIFVVEFTWQTTLLLPVVLGVFIGFMLSEIFSVKPLYDLLLEDMLERSRRGSYTHEYTTRIQDGALACGKQIGDILWQEGTIFHAIERDGQTIVPGSETVLLAGDKLSLSAEVEDIVEFDNLVEEIVKPQSRLAKIREGSAAGRLQAYLKTKTSPPAEGEEDDESGEIPDENNTLITIPDENNPLSEIPDEDGSTDENSHADAPEDKTPDAERSSDEEGAHE